MSCICKWLFNNFVQSFSINFPINGTIEIGLQLLTRCFLTLEEAVQMSRQSEAREQSRELIIFIFFYFTTTSLT